ncbi:putative phage DNA primase [Pseudogulbenkiania sp. NH8B]|nr:putative phage DNA primase [Pseudogulbenkiania sp. NH8B]
MRRATFRRWPDLLAALGIPAEVLSKKSNQPCPACGGTDRFQFIDKGQGRFVCRALEGQGGDGFTLAMHWLNADFKTALQAVAGVLGMAEGIGQPLPPPAAPAPAKTAAPRDDSTKLRLLWGQAQPIQHGDPVDRYLTGRGLVLGSYPDALRHHPALPYWCEVDGQTVRLGTYPVMLAAVTSPACELVGLHRTYLTPEGQKARPIHPGTGETLDAKKLLTAFDGAMNSAAIQLYPPRNGELAVCEGIETGLAVWLGSGLPVWPCVSAWGLEHAQLPESVSDTHIMGDHDVSGTGQRAAQRLAQRLAEEGRRVRVHIPTTPGTDWLDVYQSREQEAA